MVQRAGIYLRLCRGHERETSPPLKPHRYDMVDELCRLVERAGLRLTFDSRRYARAAMAWPHCLPPMFSELSIRRERWVAHSPSPASRPHWHCERIAP